ncbi:4-diphosphocytidyl-2C-methyl-D-erythritol kinase [Marmoricola sp. Leaf446]|uniref:IspD/TarI family cytidylyltransferase n=1 Tax=Marmoricola sp. Leaf446 TaxID=1736379 RepID=UPI0006F3A8E3|nr:IspD/TarI family cytidylyltransferase [Marmoricola sp. Leaf446]KQT92299.1 4-diphosphocytidyl-2C-methyl-D-erythritol kinase [Marmoricola sp. Leaf446]
MTAPPPRTAAVLLAAGSGTRVGADRNKVLLDLVGVPVLVWSVRTVLAVEGVHRVVLVVRPEDTEAVREAVAPHLGPHDLWVVDGGEARHDSEWRALQVLAPDVEAGELDVVAIHDAARPLATPALWRAVVEAAVEHGGALPVTRVPALLGRDGRPAPDVVAVQTPQAFRAPDLLAAHRQARADGFVGTDTAACLERYTELTVVGVPSDTGNLKVTWPEDLALAAELVAAGRGD